MRQFILATLIVVFSAGATLAVTQSVSFQNGLNGYTGTFDRRISSAATDESNGADSAAYFLDGFAPDGTDANTDPDSPDTQGLIRFDNIFGNGAGQIPAGATILDAKLTLTTSLAGNSQTNGPYGVAGLSQAFNATTSFFTNFMSTTDYTSRGAWWQDGYATRPVGGYGFQIPGVQDTANVTPIVQSWSAGSPNNGFVIQAGLSDTIATAANTSDGWSIHTTGFPTSDTRPKLEVTYTTNPIQMRTFQRGTNGYSDDTMAIVRSGFNALNPDPSATPPEITEDASLLDQTFLDGVLFSNTAGDTSSVDDLALLKFANVFGNGPSQAPADVPVAKAWAVITTGDLSTAATSSGPFTAHTMLRAWDFTSLHSSFGTVNGLQVGEGDISPALDSEDGFVRGAEVWFDVTAYLEGVRNGATDNGIAILTTGTADGWQIHTNGSTTANARPRLVVLSGNVAVSVGLTGDYNDNGVVDAADYVVWRNAQGSANALPNDPLGGTVGQGQYDQWRANYGKVGNLGGPLGSGAAVPEPATWLIAVVTALAAIGARRRK